MLCSQAFECQLSNLLRSFPAQFRVGDSLILIALIFTQCRKIVVGISKVGMI